VLLFYAAKGMLGLEAWMREEERRDIREEIEKTGTFISSYAGDVETSIDVRRPNTRARARTHT
jgi:hypothetical protein